MVVLNDMDRFHLVMDVIDRVPGLARPGRAALRQQMADTLVRHRAWTRSTARTCPRSATGSGPAAAPRRPMHVLVVNAGSSSLKLTRARRRRDRGRRPPT